MISLEEYKKFYLNSVEHEFDDNDGVFIDHYKLHKNITFGFNSLNHLVIIFPKDIYRTNIGIKNVCELKGPKEYSSVLDNSIKISGCPLFYNSDSIDKQFKLLNHINDMVALME